MIADHVVVMKYTTERQLRFIKEELDQRYNEITTLWNEAQRNADYTDQIDPDLDDLFHALTNFLMDIELDGME